MSTEHLLNQEVDGKVPTIPQAELEQTYEESRFRFGDQPKAEVMTQIQTGAAAPRAGSSSTKQYRRGLRDMATSR